jgi:hypothetical protein
MKRKVVFLQENMADDNDMVIFEADIPYEVEGNSIQNENCLKVALDKIWVDFHLVHQKNR